MGDAEEHSSIVGRIFSDDPPSEDRGVSGRSYGKGYEITFEAEGVRSPFPQGAYSVRSAQR